MNSVAPGQSSEARRSFSTLPSSPTRQNANSRSSCGESAQLTQTTRPFSVAHSPQMSPVSGTRPVSGSVNTKRTLSASRVSRSKVQSVQPVFRASEMYQQLSPSEAK